ncbi:hypothetical protein JHW43_003989 [Diplocarpon mali]|nr:hypothetical protein JHW43_003989 [Diplocarpon mali]
MGIAPATRGPILIDQNSPGPDATVDGRRRYTSQAAYGPGVLGWAHRHRRHRRHRHPAMGWCGGEVLAPVIRRGCGELDLTGLIYVGSRGQQTPRYRYRGGGEGKGGEKEEEEEEERKEKEEEEKKEKEGEEEEEYKEEKEEEEEEKKEKEETYLHL